MLFTDNDVISQADLIRVDSELPLVATAAQPALLIDGAGSICESAWTEGGQKILAAMQMYAGYLVPWGTSPGQVAGVLYTGAARTQPRVRLNQIVAHEWNYGNAQSPIQAWLTYEALALFYRDASSRLGKDRYQEKYERYLGDAGTRWRTLRSNGLPMVYQPLEAPGAKHGFNAGSWTASNLSAVTAGGASGGTFSVAITYTDASKYSSQTSKGNGESGPSDTLSLVVAAGNALSVSIASLNPPTGVMDAVGLAQGSWTPLNATHWNLWAGDADGPLYLQQEKIPIATKTFSLSADPTLSGSTIGNGQYPDIPLVFLNIAMRA